MQELSAFVEWEKGERKDESYFCQKQKSHTPSQQLIYISYIHVFFFVKCIFMTIHVCF